MDELTRTAITILALLFVAVIAIASAEEIYSFFRSAFDEISSKIQSRK